MKKILFCFICGITAQILSAQTTENVFLITLDGLRWQELFTGADSALIDNKDYVHNVDELKSLFWANTTKQRRQKLMPFFWSTIASEGQIYGNRNLGNFVNCSNRHWFSYPGYSEILCGFADDEQPIPMLRY